MHFPHLLYMKAICDKLIILYLSVSGGGLYATFNFSYIVSY